MAKAFISARSSTVGSSFSMLGADVTVNGDITASADLHIDGNVHGDLSCNALVQGEGSEIHGAIRTQSVRIGGLVRGSVSARDVVILKTARIEGDVSYETLTIEQGARLDGRLSPGATQTAATPIARLPKLDDDLILPAAAE